MPSAVSYHLGPSQLSRVVYGAIIGLALIVALEGDEPGPAVMVATLVGTGVAVGLTEVYSELVGTEIGTRRRVGRTRLREMTVNAIAVIAGVAFPAVFFGLAAAGALETHTAFDIAKWSGLPLTGFYGLCAARLRGEGWPAALLQAVMVALIGGFLIVFKALVH